MKKIPLYRPLIGDDELQEVQRALALKVKSEELEDAFCNYIGCEYGVSVVNETASLHLAMTTIDLKRGDKILCSVNSYPNVPEVVRHFDAEPIFVDIDEEDYNIDLNALEKILHKNRSKKLKGVMVNHVAGQPTDLDRLYEMAQHYGVMVIEEAHNAMGATYKGQKIGSLSADITSFSFNPHKRFSLHGGAMMLTKNEELKDRARLLQNNAIIKSSWEEGKLGYIYDTVDIGLEYDLSDLEASFCLAQLKKVDSAIERRKEIAKIYFKELEGVPHVELPEVKRDHIFSMFIIKIDKNRDSFARELYKRGIETGLHYIPLHLMSYYKQKYNLRINDYPKALKNYQQILSIPIDAAMSDEEVLYVIEQIKEVAKSWI